MQLICMVKSTQVAKAQLEAMEREHEKAKAKQMNTFSEMTIKPDSNSSLHTPLNS
jgi:hypothetical protein